MSSTDPRPQALAPPLVAHLVHLLGALRQLKQPAEAAVAEEAPAAEATAPESPEQNAEAPAEESPVEKAPAEEAPAEDAAAEAKTDGEEAAS